MADFKDDIKKYRNGELTSAEMHDLEKRALSDPFLADALEGADTISSEDFSTDISKITEKLLTQNKKSGWFRPLRIAAGIVLLTGSIFLVYNFNQPDENLALKKEEPSVPGISHLGDTILKKDEVQLLSLNPPKEETESKIKPDLKTTGPSPTKTDGGGEEKQGAGISATIQTAPASANDQVADQAIEAELSEIESKEKSLESEKIVAAEPSQQDLKKEKSDNDFVVLSQSRKSELNDDVQQKVVRGTVTEAEDGLPLPGVSVTIKGTTIGTMTNMQGNYSISLKSGTQTLVFSFAGLESNEEFPKDNPILNIKLREDVSYVSQIVVIGITSTRDDKDTPVLKLTEPVGGKKAYDWYVESNLRYPQQALESRVKGKVTIGFTVGSDGALRNFMVTNSLGYGCDEEAMRLVKQGPKWTPGTENTANIQSKVRVKIKFDPEKVKK